MCWAIVGKQEESLGEELYYTPRNDLSILWMAQICFVDLELALKAALFTIYTSFN